MRWKIKIPEPKVGDMRVIERFAWLPKKVEHSYVWLGLYGVVQTYVRRRSLGADYYLWMVTDTFLYEAAE